MKYKFSFPLLFLILSLNIQAQQGKWNQSPDKLLIKGSVIDDITNQGLQYASVAIYSKLDSSVLGGGLTNENGSFIFEVSGTEMYAKIDFISYKTLRIDPIPIPEGGREIDLGTLILDQESEVLDDIEITAERSETSFSLDKKVFTVGKDLANQGGTAEDVLDNVPSVTVDIDGNVSLRGSDGVRLLIDGRPSSLAGVGNANGLRSIPSNLIEKVEVITNPSARYDAEGMAGIINIVLKKNQAAGFNGAINLSGGYPENAGISANLNYRKNKLNWFVNYGLNYRSGPGGGSTIQDQLLYDSDLDTDIRQISIQNREQDRNSISNSVRFGADYFINEKEQLTASLLYRKSDEDNLARIEYRDYIAIPSEFSIPESWTKDLDELRSISFDDFENSLSQDNLDNITSRTDDEIEDETNLQYSLNYRKEFSSREHNLNAVIQYRDKSEIESSLFENRFAFQNIPTVNQRSNNDEGDNTWLIKADYVHPLGKDHKWETGIQSSLREIKNDFLVEDFVESNWISADGLSNNFIYDENIQSAYFIYGNTLNKFGFQLGVRSEHSMINTRLLQSEDGAENKRTFFNFFPSGHFNYHFNDKNALQISYSRRVRRPRFRDLNPFFTFSDNRNFYSGNPNVNPEFTDSYELGQILYLDNFSLSSSIFYRSTDASIQRILAVDNFEGTTLRVPLNIGQIDDYGLDISFSYSGLTWLRIDANWNLFRNQLSVDNAETFDAVYNYYKVVRDFDEGIDAFINQYDFTQNETDNITWNGRLTARFTFWKSDLQIRTNYRGPRETSQGSRKAAGSLDIGWSKDFLNNKLTVTLSVRDLFNSRKRNGITLLDDFFQKSKFQWRSRSSTLTFSYRINQKKNKSGNRDSRQDQGDFEGGEF